MKIKNTASTANSWPFLRKFITLDRKLEDTANNKGPCTVFLYEFIRFGIKQAWACLFGGLMVILLILSYLYYPKPAALPRYDFLVLASISIQIGMIAFGLESKKEAKTILIFHLIGTIMEIFKTNMGSWRYPELSYLKIFSVPLFTGFMYASVGSYLARVWHLFQFKFNIHPSKKSLLTLSTAVYINFFTHHYTYDFRYVLFALSIYLFWGSWIHFKVSKTYRKMPMILGLLLVTFFIWIAENVGTYTSAWVYPS